MAQHIFDDIAAGILDAIATAPHPLAGLDQTTVRALCDAGYVTARDYLAAARTAGWQPSGLLLDETKMQQQARDAAVPTPMGFV